MRPLATIIDNIDYQFLIGHSLIELQEGHELSPEMTSKLKPAFECD